MHPHPQLERHTAAGEHLQLEEHIFVMSTDATFWVQQQAGMADQSIWRGSAGIHNTGGGWGGGWYGSLGV